MAETVLKIEGLELRAGSNIIAHDISFELEKGRVLGLIGESGAGKSTIGLAAMGYTREGMRITAGSVKLLSTEMTTLSRKQLDTIRGVRVTYVAQSAASAFNPAFTILEQVIEASLWHGLMTRKQAISRAIELFRLLNLPEPETIGHRYPHQLSGGQLQRAMTAMALCPQPDLVVFDEPTTALDVTTQVEVLVAIKQAITTLGIAALYISHDLAVVAQITDEILVLRHGAMIEKGTAEQIFTAPENDYTRALVQVAQRETEQKPALAETILQINGLYAGYNPAMPVLKNISLEIGRGETLAVVGESGSGKSTLARVVTGLLEASHGSMQFDGDVLAPVFQARGAAQLRDIQMISQLPDLALNPGQTIGDCIGRPLSFYFGLRGREKQQAVQDLLERMELPEHFAGRYPSELSGGQKQRVCIARALAARPKLILCDEPTSALDPLVADGILELLQKIQTETGTSYLFITHDLAIVRAIADKVAVMHRGEIVRYGAREAVFTPPFDAYTAKLFSSVPEMRSDWLDDIMKQRAETA